MSAESVAEHRQTGYNATCTVTLLASNASGMALAALYGGYYHDPKAGFRRVHRADTGHAAGF